MEYFLVTASVPKNKLGLNIKTLNQVYVEYIVSVLETLNLSRSEEVRNLYQLTSNNGSSHPEVFLGKNVLKICSKFTREHPRRNVISIKLQSNRKISL